MTAGICEEIIYRGLLIATLEPLVGLAGAIAVSSVVFGLGHVHQGATGVARVVAVGLVIALVAVTTGSLLVAMVVHAVVDLAQGRMLMVAVQHGAGAERQNEPPSAAEVSSGRAPLTS